MVRKGYRAPLLVVGGAVVGGLLYGALAGRTSAPPAAAPKALAYDASKLLGEPVRIRRDRKRAHSARQDAHAYRAFVAAALIRALGARGVGHINEPVQAGR